MPTWTIPFPEVPAAGRCQYRIRGMPDGEAALFFEVEGMDLPAPDGTPALLALLLPAMRRGADLRVEGAVDPLLLRQLPGIQRIIAAWMPGLNPVVIHARPGPVRAATPQTGVFFSGGADSWYSLLKYAGIATHALHVWGFDVRLANPAMAGRIQETLRPAIGRKGVAWVRIRTNLRDFTDPHTQWGEQQHGCAMAAVAALLAPAFGRVVMAGSYPFQLPEPFASHPVLDPLWSTSGCTLIHDGVEASRPEKLGGISGDADAVGTLRVCFDNPDGAYNCGRCFKCSFTMLGLLIVDPRASFPTFEARLTPESLTACPITEAFWFRSLQSRLDGIRTILPTRPDLAPYAQALTRRLALEAPHLKTAPPPPKPSLSRRIRRCLGLSRKENQRI